MTIANISILLLFSVLCAVASATFGIEAISEYRYRRDENDIFKEKRNFKTIRTYIQASFFLIELSVSYLFGAAYIAWAAYV